MADRSAIIIGAGYSGLSCACLLAKQGWRVTVIEKNSGVGGRAQTFSSHGFLFDMGPSWYLMPYAFNRLFGILDTSPEEHFKLVRLDPSYQIFSSDGRIVVRPELDENRDTFNRLEENGYDKVRKYLKRAEKQYDISVEHFLYRHYQSLRPLLTPGFLWKGMQLGVFQNVDQLARKAFKSDLLQKIMGYTMVFIGGSPAKTPGFYSLMSYIDLCLNVWYPLGGMGEPALALKRIAEELQVEFVFNTPVRSLPVTERGVQEVETDRSGFRADIVVANADYHHVETRLLDKKFCTLPESYWKKRTVSPTAFIIYMGLNKKLAQLQHHNLYFHGNWEEHFATIFDDPAWPDQYSYYVCCPSFTDKRVAPEGQENLFFLVPVAPGLEDSDPIREVFAQGVVEHFEKLIGEKIRDSIVFKQIFSQRDFISEYYSLKGSAFGLSHTLMQTAFFRPPHRSKKVKNLFFTGQYTHPGVGVPMTLISAEILADLIKKIYD